MMGLLLFSIAVSAKVSPTNFPRNGNRKDETIWDSRIIFQELHAWLGASEVFLAENERRKASSVSCF